MDSAAMRVTDHVATRLVRACLSRKGALGRHSILQAATRCALLADLALTGALSGTEHSIEFGPGPIGFAPADTLLSMILAQPDRTIQWWLDNGPRSADDVLHALVDSGIWTAHRFGLEHRYADHDPQRPAADRALAQGDNDDVLDPRTATFVVLARAAGLGRLIPVYPSARLVRGCGPVAWLVPDLAEYLTARIEIARAASSAANQQIIIGGL